MFSIFHHVFDFTFLCLHVRFSSETLFIQFLQGRVTVTDVMPVAFNCHTTDWKFLRLHLFRVIFSSNKYLWVALFGQKFMRLLRYVIMTWCGVCIKLRRRQSCSSKHQKVLHVHKHTVYVFATNFSIKHTNLFNSNRYGVLKTELDSSSHPFRPNWHEIC